MEVVERGHRYLMRNADGPGSQVVQFVRRRDGRGEFLPPERKAEGILTQELLRVAIDRTLYLYAEAPCAEDTAIIEKLRECLALYESRAARRAIEKLSKPEEATTCRECGHILCLHATNFTQPSRSPNG